ncbi:MAG: hypothetical protein ACXWQR_00560 [Ktedonobacterales bacterium]
MALTLTNAGLNLMRDVLTGAATSGKVFYLALGNGGATLNAALTNGSAYTTLTTTALPAALTSGQSITLASGNNTQAVTLSANASLGATSISVTSFTANFSYPVGTGLVNTPSVNDTQLQHEYFRKAVTSVANGGANGEALVTVYLAPGDSNAQIQEVGWFAGATATSSANTGTLLARGVYSHNHTGLESITFTLDATF